MQSQKQPKLLTDVGVGQKVNEWIKTTEYNTKFIRDINPRMSDVEILKLAVSEKRLLITMDKDFGELIYKSKQPHSGVLLLRLEDESANEKIKVLEAILKDHLPKIINNFSVYNEKKLRVRK